MYNQAVLPIVAAVATVATAQLWSDPSTAHISPHLYSFFALIIAQTAQTEGNNILPKLADTC